MSWTVYIAGKITGDPLHEVTAKFGEAEQRFKSLGFNVVNPLAFSVGKEITWAEAMKKCIAALVLCDSVHMLKDWKESKGAKIEHDLAMALNIPIIYQK